MAEQKRIVERGKGIYQLISRWFRTRRKGGFVRRWITRHFRKPDGDAARILNVKLLYVDDENACLVVRTQSGKRVYLSFPDSDFAQIANARDLFERKLSSDSLKKMQDALEKHRAEVRAEMDSILNKGELFLELRWSQMRYLAPNRAYFKDGSGTVHTIKTPRPGWAELGSYYLVTDGDGGFVDFRYFALPDDNCIKPDHWSDGLEAVKIKNRGKSDIYFLGSHRKILCKPGEVTVIERGEYSGEGLFPSATPDMVRSGRRFVGMGEGDTDFSCRGAEQDRDPSVRTMPCEGLL